MVRDLLMNEFPCYLALLGRRGQDQGGVDLIGSRRLSSEKNERWGIQCAVRAGKIEPSKISGDLIAADEKYPALIVNRDGTSYPNRRRLDALSFVTSADRDVKAQTALDGLSDGREKQGQSRLEILFWDDIEDLLFKHQHVYAFYYPDIFSFAVDWHGRYRGQAALELGFQGYSLCGHSLFSLENRIYNSFDSFEFEDFRRKVDNLVEVHRRLSSTVDTNDTLLTLAAFVGEPGSPPGPHPDPQHFVMGGIFPQWLNKVMEELQPTERSFMYVGWLLAQGDLSYYQQSEMQRRNLILSVSSYCTPKDKPLLSNLFRHLNQKFPKVNDPIDARSWSYQFFNEWSKRLFRQAIDALVPLPNQTPHSLPESINSV